MQTTFFDALHRWDEIIIRHPTNRKIDITIDVDSLPPGVLGGASVKTYMLIDQEQEEVYTNMTTLSGKFTISDLYVNNMKIDIRSDGKSTLYYVCLHEIGHILGIGPFWSFGAIKYLESDTLRENPYYAGINATREYIRYFSEYENIQYLPIEDNGSQGTKYVHPEEGHEDHVSTDTREFNGILHPGLDKELMTGWADTAPSPLPLSRITIGFLEDIGYEVNYLAADTYRGIAPL